MITTLCPPVIIVSTRNVAVNLSRFPALSINSHSAAAICPDPRARISLSPHAPSGDSCRNSKTGNTTRCQPLMCRRAHAGWKALSPPYPFRLEVATRKRVNSFEAVYHCKSASQAILSRMQLPLDATRRTPHGASRLVQAISARSVKTRRARSVKTRRALSRHCT